ncbi:MAG: serine hydrolase domain-containing protein [Chitinophagaceae bacterium]
MKKIIERTKIMFAKMFMMLTIAACALEGHAVGSEVNSESTEDQDELPQGKLTIPHDVKMCANKRISHGYTPGLAMSVVGPDGRDDRLTLGKTGFHETDDAIQDDTLFEIGSLTKTFTGLLLAHFICEGKVNLDDSITQHMPQLSLPKKDNQDITFRHLVTHMSGLPHIPEDLLEYSPFENPYQNYPKNRFFEWIQSSELAFTPGDHHEYCNSGMALLGMVLSHVGQKPYRDLIQDYILDPLGMKDTVFPPHSSDKSIAKAHFGDEEIPLWDVGIFAATGGLRSTLHDMMLYVKAQLGLTHKNTPIGKAIALSHEKIGDIMAYGIGKGRDDHGHMWLSHNGGTAGSSCRILLDVDRKRGGILLTHNSLEKNLYLLYPALTDDLQEREKIIADLTPDTFAPINLEMLKNLSGSYKGNEGTVTMHVEGNALVARYEGIDLIIKAGHSRERFYPVTSGEGAPSRFFLQSNGYNVKHRRQYPEFWRHKNGKSYGQ